jgi:hypothetical protein
MIVSPFFIPSRVNANEIDWILDNQFSTNKETWFGDLGIVKEGTPLFYQIILQNNADFDIELNLFDELSGEIITTTLSARPMTVTLPSGPITQSYPGNMQASPGNWYEIISSGPYSALLGPHSYVVTGTVSAIYTSTLVSTLTSAASYTGTSSAVPEPATFLLVGLGFLGFAGLRKKLRRSTDRSRP